MAVPQRYKSRILQHVAHRAYEPKQVRELAEDLGVPPAEHEAFREAVEELIDADQVVLGDANKVALPPIGREVTGRFKRHERGFGFILPDTPSSHGDVYVDARDTAGALTGDRVRADVVHRPRGKRHSVQGVVAEIIQRGNTTFVGRLERRGKTWVVHPDGKALNQPVLIRDIGAKAPPENAKVVVDLTVFPENRNMPEGVITEVLGDAGQPDVETAGVMRAFNLPEKFNEPVVNEARDATADYNEHTGEYIDTRLDLRALFTATIDPPDARDFDDAISIEPTDDGYELGIHIADVATFVRPDSELDLEARERGNSAYLPRLVVPMLPEVLSNGICSLQPGVPRLAKSVFIEYDRKANVKNTRFANSVIQSNFRMTYLEAQGLIDGDRDEALKHQVHEQTYNDELVAKLKLMDELARSIRKRRLSKGMIVLDLPEVELVFDERGHVVDAHPEDDAFTHKIIEAFMVEANEAVAAVFADMDVPLLRRVHPEPDAHGTGDLRRFARVAGFNIPSNPSPKEIQALLDATRGKPAQRAVHLAVLKTLTKAEYAPAQVGHFALASDHYAHFTSPIRRYADLTVHRALEALLEHVGDKKSLPRGLKARQQLGKTLHRDERCPDEESLTEIGKHCSATERNAEQAERELRDVLVLQLMTRYVGDHFDGTVTGVTGFGIFVQIDKYLVEGLIKTDQLPGAPAERWKLNEHTAAMTAERSGRAIQIGDTFKVVVNAVDLPKREMDLQIVENHPQKKTKKGAPRREDKPKVHKSRGGRRRKGGR